MVSILKGQQVHYLMIKYNFCLIQQFFQCTVCYQAGDLNTGAYAWSLVSWAGSSAKAAYLYLSRRSISHCFKVILLALCGSSGFWEWLLVHLAVGMVGSSYSFQDNKKVKWLEFHSSKLNHKQFWTAVASHWMCWKVSPTLFNGLIIGLPLKKARWCCCVICDIFIQSFFFDNLPSQGLRIF